MTVIKNTCTGTAGALKYTTTSTGSLEAQSTKKAPHQSITATNRLAKLKKIRWRRKKSNNQLLIRTERRTKNEDKKYEE